MKTWVNSRRCGGLGHNPVDIVPGTPASQLLGLLVDDFDHGTNLMTSLALPKQFTNLLGGTLEPVGVAGLVAINTDQEGVDDDRL
jgi:hypothetical protein